ncbi:hypothetical protein ACQP04_20900 [Pseudonocardia halophobica]|uniref:hypothetical protein n=1 Tax=Pseudonocardia halophobica TaxID=29401 RepID=UPI003D91E0AE
MAGRTLFREGALEAYRRATGRDVLPRVTSWPVVLCSWLLLAGLLAAVVLAWSVRVPTYAAGPGLVPDQQRGDQSVVVLFLPPDQSAQVRPGQIAQGRIGASGPSVRGEVTTIERDLIGPAHARDRFHLDNSSDLVTEPSMVVIVRLEENLPTNAYAGSHVTAQVQTGSQPLLASLPALGGLFGGGE